MPLPQKSGGVTLTASAGGGEHGAMSIICYGARPLEAKSGSDFSAATIFAAT